MWYFSWILALGLAVAFAVLNAMWFELHADAMAKKKADEETPPRSRAGLRRLARHRIGIARAAGAESALPARAAR